MHISELLDKARKTCSLNSDAALGDRVGKTRQVVHHWRTTGAWPENKTIARLAALAGEDAEPWLVEAGLGKADSESERRAWKRLAELLGHAAAVALVAVLAHSPALSKTPDGSTEALNSATKQGTSIHYAQLIGIARTILKRAKSAFRGICHLQGKADELSFSML